MSKLPSWDQHVKDLERAIRALKRMYNNGGLAANEYAVQLKDLEARLAKAMKRL